MARLATAFIRMARADLLFRSQIFVESRSDDARINLVLMTDDINNLNSDEDKSGLPRQNHFRKKKRSPGPPNQKIQTLIDTDCLFWPFITSYFLLVGTEVVDIRVGK